MTIKKQRNKIWLGSSIGMVVFFMFITAIVRAESLEKGSNWISNGLVKISAPSDATRIECAIKDGQGNWKNRLYPRDWGQMGEGANLMTLYDENIEEIEALIKDGQATLIFKKVNKTFTSGENQNGWRRYQVTIFPESYQVKISCIDSSKDVGNKCNWYIELSDGCDYLMSENELWDAAADFKDSPTGGAGVSTGDNEYGVLWGLNTEFLVMLHYPGIEKVGGYYATAGKQTKFIQFMLMGHEKPFSVFVYPTKKMITGDEVKAICNKLVQGAK